MNTPVKRAPIPFGKYLLLDRINIGGMAEVWRGKTFGAGGFERLVAIKRILPNIAEDEEFISMFIDEAKITVQLNHANIAQIYELSHIASSYFIAMEYIPGKDMRAIFDRCRKKGEPAPIPLTCYVVGKCCEGLDYAHRKQVNGRDLTIVHRDVSPQNVLISYEGEVKVIDFGIAKAAGKATKTQAGILKGKFGYMSPEQIRGLPLDRRSDVFAIGVCLYEMLTGERLFVGDSDFSVLEKVRKVEVLPPSTYNRKIPEGLEKIVMKALAKDVDDRYQYASEVADDLQRFLITSESIFSRKDLAQYMKSTFAEEVEREKQRLIEYSEIKSAELMGQQAPVPGSTGFSEQLPPTVASAIGSPMLGSSRSSHPSLPQVGASHAHVITHPQSNAPRAPPPMLTPSPLPSLAAPTAPQDQLPALSGRPSSPSLPRVTAASPMLTNGKEDPSTHLVDAETLFNPGMGGAPENPESATISMDSPFSQGLTVTGEVGGAPPTDPARPAVARSNASVISTSEHTPATPIAPLSPVLDSTLPPSAPGQSLAQLAKATVVESPRANPVMRGRPGGGRSNPTMSPIPSAATDAAAEARPLSEPKSGPQPSGLQQRRRRTATAPLPGGGPGASMGGQTAEPRRAEPATVPSKVKESSGGGGTGKILFVLMAAVVLVLGAAVTALFVLKPEAKGLIVIEVPDTAEVTDLNINGDSVTERNFPLLQKVAAGNVTVLIKAKGYKPVMETLAVKADGVPARLTQTFEKVGK